MQKTIQKNENTDPKETKINVRELSDTATPFDNKDLSTPNKNEPIVEKTSFMAKRNFSTLPPESPSDNVNNLIKVLFKPKSK